MAEVPVLASFGWLASPLFKTLLDRAHDYLGTGIDERRILEATVLPRLSLSIEKAEKSDEKRQLVDWLRKLKDAYYEAEEAIDLLEYEKLKQEVKDHRNTLQQKEKKERRRTRICSPSQFVPQHLKIALVKLKYGLSVSSQQKIMLKGCIDKLVEIAKEANEFLDLLEVHENTTGSDSDRETISEPPIRVFGREFDKANIVYLLTDKPFYSEPGPSTISAIPIIAIIGRFGAGKTALAQYVYEHMDKLDHFDLCVWVHTRRKFKAIDVIKNMIEIIKAKERASNDCPSTSLETLYTEIRSMLGSKKLLLVLDDFWNDTEDFVLQWEIFIDCLSRCSPGSRILLTTQSKNVEEKVNLLGATEVMPYDLQEIEEDQFLELFMHYAWSNNSHLKKEEFKIIGRRIAVKLEGDPGAAKLVGQQLWGKNLRYWVVVAEKDWLGDNMKASTWSYQKLPQNLQRCFAICSLFPKGTQLPRELLIYLWMAEGFVVPKYKQDRLEDISEKYLHELKSRFFLQKVVDNEKKIFYQLHDLHHNLAEQVQGDDFIRIDSTNSREVISSHKSNMSYRRENIRHIFLPSSMINELKETLCLMKNVRTFCVQSDGVVPKKELEEILKHMGKLRVLQLPECGDELPNSIGKLKHLRYLHINGFGPLKKLPDSICKLYHLQTLALPNCESLPKNFYELVNLRCFDAPWETLFRISHVGRLTSLQGLRKFNARNKHGNELRQLENLNQLRGEMHITGLENVESIEDAIKANMQNKRHLEALEFEWNSNERATDNVTDLSTQHVQLLNALQPHPNTSALTLKGFGGDRFPNWLLSRNSLRHLTSLTLVNCDKVEEISSMHKSLPNCRSLKLWGLNNLKKMPSLPPELTYLAINLPHLSYFSEEDLLMKEERKQSKLEVVNQTTEFIKLEYKPLPSNLKSILEEFLQLMKERLEVAAKICIPNNNNDDQLLDAWEMFMHCHIETMFNNNEESRLVLPSSLTYLDISSCSITDDALSTCIQCLVSLSKLKLSHIQTITSFPPKEVLCSLKYLKFLSIKGCYLLSSLGGIGVLTSLTGLELIECINLNTSNEPLPCSLEILKYSDCPNIDVIIAESYLPFLRSLEVRDKLFKNPRGVLRVGDLPSLKELTVDGLDGCLVGLEELPKNLRQLKIKDCPTLTEKFNKGGPYQVRFDEGSTTVTFPTEE